MRRDRELASLYATARALTALDEVDVVLAAIVRHAHELLGADVTYLSVYDPEDGHLALRAVEGAVSSAFHTARVPPDTGVSGRIRATAAPFWVADYLADTTLVRDPGFDVMSEEEGLAAMLGVPLRDKEGVFGALFVAERFSRSFEVEEVALLSAFADHAAVALQNARLYDESRRALTEVRAAYAAMERSAQVHEALTRVVLDGGGAAEIAELLVAELGGRVTVLGRRGGPAATRADAHGAPELDAERMRTAVRASQATGRPVVLEQDPGAEEWHCVTALLAGEASLGTLVLSRRSAPAGSAVQTLERAAQILALLTLKQDAVVEAEERVRGELLAELLTAPRPYPDELLARAAARGLEAERLSVVLAVESPGRRAAELGRRLDALARERAGIGGDYAGAALMLLPAGEPGTADDGAREAGSGEAGSRAADVRAREVHAALRARLRAPVLVAAAPVPGGGGGLRKPSSVARRCLRVLRAMGVEDRGTSTTRLGMYALLFDPDRDGELREFVADQLGPLLEYDARRRTELVTTLAKWFDSGGVLTHAAAALHIHMNTLVKRMDRIDRILGAQWREPHRALEIEVAVRLHALSAALV